ncbi:PH domain-containing protein [Nocardioides nanhaiensis]|uniref:PH domain-containing protein n=1 Tax=Nocardioides nanhaiensis TaxID=1476871 RepID=A0ABP8WVK0_9ACTN
MSAPAPPPAAVPALREPAQRVDPRARLMWIVSSVVESVVTLGIIGTVVVLTGVVELRWWMVAGVVALDLLYVAVVPHWRYLVHRWEVTETAVHTQVGWWSRERRIAPISRIQTVDYAEGPVERLFGLASVTVTTASAAGALSISGLRRDRARRLVDELTLRADAVEGDAT